MKIQSPIDMFQPAAVIAPPPHSPFPCHRHSKKTFISFRGLFVVNLWLFPPSLPLLIWVKCNHSPHMWAPAVESTGKCGHLRGNVQQSTPFPASQQLPNSADVQRTFSIWERGSQTGYKSSRDSAHRLCRMWYALLKQRCIKLKEKSVWRVTPTRSVSQSRLIVQSDRT